MPTHASFRFSTYLTLALSCIAVGAAEHDILPEVGVFAFLAVVALGVLYFLESRVALLSIPSANRLGGVIIGLYVLWAAYRIKRAINYNEYMNMGWQTFVVALCGPAVMVALVAKVARREKHAGDYWTLHGLALAGIGMAAAFAEETSSFLLVGVYLIMAVWSLTLLYLGRASGVVPPVPGGRMPATKALTISPDPTGHRLDLGPAIVWAVIALLIAIPLYLITPRSEALKLNLGKPRIEIGYAADQMVDLNQSGPLTTNPEMAFEFTATNADGSPKTDISPSQRWRGGRIFRQYLNGEWKTGSEVLGTIIYATPDGKQLPDHAPRAHSIEKWTEPQLGPGQFTISYEVPSRLGTWFLADPVIWAPNQPPPVAYLTTAGPHSFFAVSDGTFFWPDTTTRPSNAIWKYVQAYRKSETPDVSPPFRFIIDNTDKPEAQMRDNPVRGVKQFADAILRELIETKRLPEDCLDKEKQLPLPQYQEQVASEFAAYLSRAPGFKYTTDLRRVDRKVDPVEEFLVTTKEGHCERYAAALVLMLRSQGIAAQYVLGFKGCEHTGDGKYIVRQEHAHAWCEALVPKAGEPYDPKEPQKNVYHWVTLDPTPGAEETTATDRTWLAEANSWVQLRFQEYVKDYTPEQRRKAILAFFEQLTRPVILVGIACVVLLLFGARFTIRRLRRHEESPPPPSEPSRWFGELVKVLTSHGITPAPGETPLEYANSASAALHQRGCEEVADVPLAWVEAYYQDRFGGIAPSEARISELETQLDNLRQSLEKRGT